MTIRSYVLVSILFLVPFTLLSQTPKVTMTTGEKERTPLGEGTIGVVGQDDGGYMYSEHD